MKLKVLDEFSTLKKVAVCYGYSVPRHQDYQTNDPEELKWGWARWDKELLLTQQDNFFKQLQRYGVDLIILQTEPELLWQMYTRDTGFVIEDKLYYAANRTLKARNGEIKKLLDALALDGNAHIPLSGIIEGGDVLVSTTNFIGISNRTNVEAFNELAKFVNAKKLHIGEDIMHLDTRLTLLPNNYALVCLESFSKEDQSFLSSNYKVIPVTLEEAKILGTNVFVVNPETIIVEERSTRIQEKLKDAGFKIESIPYSEPILLGGSFRCTTLPLYREP